LPKPLPSNLQVMTVPACSRCNASFSDDEVRTAAIVCTVSFTKDDRNAVHDGGWVHSAMKRDAALRQFVSARLGADGIFRPDQSAIATIERVMTKTTAGLLFHEYGRVVPMNGIKVIGMEHAKNAIPSALAELHRRDDAGWAEVTPSGRELERQVFAAFGDEPPHMPKWRVYAQKFFEYLFLRRSNGMLLTALKLHDALTVLLECPWPSRAGPRRHGTSPKPNLRRRSRGKGPASADSEPK
jgi:hypothetical protein